MLPSDFLGSQQPGLLEVGTVSEIARLDVTVAYADETLRAVADRMAERWIGALPVVERGPTPRLVGIITEFDLLKARHRQLVEERERERALRLRRPAALATRAFSLGDDDRRPAPVNDEDELAAATSQS